MKPHINGLPTEMPTPPVPDISEGCFINSTDITSGVLSHIASPLQSNYDDTETPQKYGIEISEELWPYHQIYSVHQNSSGSSSNLIQFSTYLAMQLHYDNFTCLHGNPYRHTTVCNREWPVCKLRKSFCHTYMCAEDCNLLHYAATNRVNIFKWIWPEPRLPNILF